MQNKNFQFSSFISLSLGFDRMEDVEPVKSGICNPVIILPNRSDSKWQL